MKALIVGKDKTVSIQDVPLPQYGDYQALVKIKASAVCGTDLKILHQEFNGFPDYPTILGHEAVGTVVEVGSKVKNLKVGDQVLHPILYEPVGEYYATFGAMAEYAVIEDGRALAQDGYTIDEKIYHDHSRIQFKIPKSLDPVNATMLITFREIYATMRRMRYQKGESIVVYGIGPVGQVFIKFCKMLGMGPVVAVVRRESKVAPAKEAGADIVLNSSEVSVPKEVRRLFPDGVDIVLDAAGATSVINEGLLMIKPFGKICMYGVLADTEAPINWQHAPLSFDLIFTQWPDKESEIAVMDELVNMLADGRINGMDFISDVMPFEQAIEGIQLFLQRKNKKKIVFTFDD